MKAYIPASITLKPSHRAAQDEYPELKQQMAANPPSDEGPAGGSAAASKAAAGKKEMVFEVDMEKTSDRRLHLEKQIEFVRARSLS